MFEELWDHFPKLVPFVRCFYAEPSWLLLRRDSGEWELLQSSTGSRQGDPVAGQLFALPHRRALRATHAAFPNVQLPSLADNTHILGPPTPGSVAACKFHYLQGELVKLNLRVKLAKCVAYSPAGIPVPQVQLPPDFDRPAQGILTLGVPIGSAAHIHDVVGAKLQMFAQQLSTLPMLQDLQVALALLTRVFVQRLSCLMRTVVPAPDFLVQLDGFDAQILQTLEELIGSGSSQGEVGELARMQASLPTSLGGLGVRSTAGAAPAAFLGSWALVRSLGQHFLRSDLPSLESVVSNDVDAGVLPFQVALRSARDGLPQSARQILAPIGVGAGIGVAGSGV
jgi:hypothetical protein